MDQRREEIKKCDKLINSFLLRGNKFVEYAYLCNYAHCNYSILDCYLDENNMFTLSGKKDEYLVRILVLFVYTKTFESIVTVEGEDFLDKREENYVMN